MGRGIEECGVLGGAAILLWIGWVLIWLTVLSGRFTGSLDLKVGGNDWMEGAYDRLRYSWPKAFPVEDQAADPTPRRKHVVKAWFRSTSDSSVTVYEGGWWSLLSMGLFARKNEATKDNGEIEIGDHIKGTLG